MPPLSDSCQLWEPPALAAQTHLPAAASWAGPQLAAPAHSQKPAGSDLVVAPGPAVPQPVAALVAHGTADSSAAAGLWTPAQKPSTMRSVQKHRFQARLQCA